MACADVAKANAKITATNLVILSSVANICEAPALGGPGLLASTFMDRLRWWWGWEEAYSPGAQRAVTPIVPSTLTASAQGGDSIAGLRICGPGSLLGVQGSWAGASHSRVIPHTTTA